RNAYLPGLSLADSEQILDRLWEPAIRPEFTWYQHWRVGDAVMWDNRCTIHRRESFDAESRRLMLRTQIGALQAAEAAA
ncbi:MAG: TauD/TfdA dioxygenase family protein, partial [Geminicoccaceae bacterium]